MYPSKMNSFNLRSALLLGAASAAALSLATPVLADDATETVVVTGSRIPQQGLYSSSPVTVVGAQEAQLTGAVGLDNLLDSLPQNIGGESSGVDISSDGSTTVSLRGLGASRTLVLVDGKRFMPGSISSGAPSEGAVNLDEIPVAMLDHVEIMTGGASAVYGSDAVAGVVNIILKKNFEGMDVSGGYSVSRYGDGATTDMNFLMGANSANGKGNVTLFGGYTNRQQISQGARSFSQAAAGSDGTHLIFGAGNSPAMPDGAFLLEGGNTPGANAAAAHETVPGIPVAEYSPTAGGTFRDNCSFITNTCAFTHPENFFNFAPYQLNQTGQVRYNLGAEGHYEVNKQLNIYSRLMFADSTTKTQIAPVAAYTDFNIYGDNPLLSSSEKVALFGTATPAPDTFQEVFYGLRTLAIGPRHDDYEFLAYQGVVGANGDLGDNWTYDASVQYGQSDRYHHGYNYASGTNLQEAAAGCIDVGVGAGNPPCAPWNIFDLSPTANGAFTAATAKYVGVQYLEFDAVREWVGSAALTGDFGAWGGKSPWARDPISTSIGAEYRQEEGQVEPDQTLATDNALGLSGAVNPVLGRFGVSEGFGELRIPIVQEMPFIEELQFDGAYRYSSYTTGAGHVATYKYGGDWAPVEDIKFRAEWQRAVRAPNIGELYTPAFIGLESVTDDCIGVDQGSNPGLFGLCTGSSTAGHVKSAGGVTTLAGCPAGQCNAEGGGLITLLPETADTRTLGIVFTPTFFDGFTATLDYYDIKIANAISSYGPQIIMDGCYKSNPTYDPNNIFCQLIHRAPSNGGFAVSGSYIDDRNHNIGLLHPTGVDLQMNYQTDMTTFGASSDAGSIGLNFNGTYQVSWKQEASVALNTGIYDCAGYYGNTCAQPDPKYRFNLRGTWTNSTNDLLISARWRFIGSTKLDSDECVGVSPPCTVDPATFDIPDHKIPMVSYFDLASTWTVRQGLEITGGINNALDKKPPLVDSGLDANDNNANTFPNIYDIIGRQFFVNADIKF